MIHSGKPLILIADDDPNELKAVQFQLQELGYHTHGVQDSTQLRESLSEAKPMLLLLDLRFGKEDGVQLMCELLEQRPDLCVVIFTAYSSVDTAVSAIKLGAFDYLTKPLNSNRFRVLVERAIEKHVLKTRLERLERLIVEEDAVQSISGASPAIKKICELISVVAATDATVLVLGETGTGKELVARMLHDRSNRRRGPFVPVNMAALPRDLAESTLFGHEKGAFTGADKPHVGYCERADKGTLFLDEIGEMEPGLQAKLLRFLQERTVQPVGSIKSKKVDVRVVAATNRDLQAQISKGRFREDLYYRLHVIAIVVPPLRERPQDIPELATHFLQRAAVLYQKNLVAFSDAALQMLAACEWPGNVRQLENVVERVAILSKGPEIQRDDLPPEVLQPVPWPGHAVGSNPDSLNAGRSVNPTPLDKSLRPIEKLEKQAILNALQHAQGNVQQAAKLLGLGQATVYRKIKRYSISTEDRQPPAAEER